MDITLTIIALLIVIWSLSWKGASTWRAARNDQLAWFIVLLVSNTIGILDLIYIGFFQKKKMVLENNIKGE